MTSRMPTLTTERLVLRPFAEQDAPSVERLAGERRVAEATLEIPHPYPRGGGREWIATLEPAWEAGDGLVLAVTDGATGEILGAVGLDIDAPQASAELGYWIGLPYWGRGVATEAARAVVEFAASLGLQRITAQHFATNPASGRVLRKAGLRPSGVRKGVSVRESRVEDLVCFTLELGGPPERPA